jgi:hypothetical protein
LPAWILLLLARLMPTALLLARLLVRVLALLAGLLLPRVLLTRMLLAGVLVLTAHSGSPFLSVLNIARRTTQELHDRC